MIKLLNKLIKKHAKQKNVSIKIAKQKNEIIGYFC